MTISGKQVILVAVLDWGLGHASRSVPLIAELLKQDAEVILASSGRAGLLLQKHFPDLVYLECPAYNVHYGGFNLYWSIMGQLPKIFWAILQENRWLRGVAKTHRIDAVISDSRFGCYHSSIPSVLLTHQLQLQLSSRRISKIVNFFYQRWLARFRYIWVPDVSDGLSGALSFPAPFPQTTYLGCLSRFRPMQQPFVRDLLVLLSGPEPQRTRLEEIVFNQLLSLEGINTLIVQGKTDEESRQQVNDFTEVVSYLSGDALQEALSGSEIVLCRSGYSSLMDLAMMQKKAILVPTPGQPEQKYLAERCEINSWAVVVPSQMALDLNGALQMARHPDGNLGFPELKVDQQLEKIITQFLVGFFPLTK